MWTDKYANTAFAPRTKDEHISNIKSRILPWFGDYKLTEITKMDVVHLFEDLQKNGRGWIKGRVPFPLLLSIISTNHSTQL